MNENLANADLAEQAEGSQEQSETSIVQFDPISESDMQEARLDEPSIKIGNKSLKLHIPDEGEDWL